MIHYWTDSPSSQYRNRFIFHVLANQQQHFGVHARWNYFEAGHGKGPCDGIGGTCKRRASEAVKQGKTTIQDAREFYKWATESGIAIEYYFYSQTEYDDAAAYFASLSLKVVQGTLSLHAVYRAIAQGVLQRKIFTKVGNNIQSNSVIKTSI